MRLAWLRRLMAGIVVAGRELGKIPAYSDEGERRFRELRKTAGPPTRSEEHKGALLATDGRMQAPGAGAPARSDGAFSLT